MRERARHSFASFNGRRREDHERGLLTVEISTGWSRGFFFSISPKREVNKRHRMPAEKSETPIVLTN